MQVQEPYREIYWVASEAIIVSVFLYTFYMVSSLCLYAIKSKRERKHKALLFLTIASAVMALGRLISDELVAFLGWQSNDFCLNSVSVSFALYYASIGPVYLVLWLRQNQFYSNRLLQSIVSKKLVYFSRATLVILVAGSVAVLIFFEVPQATGWRFEATSSGCRDADDQQDFELVPFFLLLFNILGQVALLCLLLYPLVVNQKRQQRMPSSSSAPTTPAPKSTNPLMRQALLRSHHENQNKPTSSPQKLAVESDKRKWPPSNEDDISAIYNVSASDDEVFQFEVKQTSDARSQSDFDTDNDQPGTSYSSSKKTKKKFSRKSRNQRMDIQPSLSPIHRPRTTSSGSAKKMIASKQQGSAKSKKLKHRKRSSSERKRAKKMNGVMRKVFCLACVCVVSDIIAAIMQLVLIVPELGYLALYDVNLLINVTCIVLSFSDWRKMLVPSCIRRNERENNNDDSSSSQAGVNLETTRLSTLPRAPRKYQTTGFTANEDLYETASVKSLSSCGTGSFTLSRPTSPDTV